MGYVYFSEESILIGLVVIAAAIIVISYIIGYLFEHIEVLRNRIARLSKAAQHAELQTGVPYYTGSGIPFDRTLENSDIVYAQISKRLNNYMETLPQR